MVLPALLPELMSSRSIIPPLASATATPALPAAASPPSPMMPPLPATATLLSPPLALLTAKPPSALRSRVVWLLTRPPLTAILEGWWHAVADAAGAIVAMPKSIAATGTTRSPTSSFDRLCKMNLAAPRTCVWFVMSLSCLSVPFSNSSRAPPSLSETPACRLVIAISFLLVARAWHRVPWRVVRFDPGLSGSATIATGGGVRDRQGLGGRGIKLGTGDGGGVGFASGGATSFRGCQPLRGFRG